jgi:fructokinase
VHPELGHLRIPHERALDPFAGACPRHGDCWEGLASGPALAARWGQPGEALPDVHPAWPLQAHYLALGLVNVILTVSPQTIVVGGGVMRRAQLYVSTAAAVGRLLAGYVSAPPITPPALGERSGVLGALALAADAAQ